MSFFTVFFQMLALLIMIGVGWLAAKKGLVDANTNGHMSGMVVNIFNPCMLISAAAGAAGTVSKTQLGTACLIAAGMFLFFILVGMAVAPLFDKDAAQRKVFQLMIIFSNLGFIGIPVVRSILGEEYVVYVTPFNLLYCTFFYTYGVALMEGKLSLSSLRSMVSAGNLACLITLAIIFLDIRLPSPVVTAAEYLGGATTPAALMSIGCTLAHTPWRRVCGDVRIYILSAVKLLALPLIALPVLRLLPIDAGLLSVCVVMFGMPVGNMPLMLTNQKGINADACTAGIIMTTILCVVTVPVLLAVAG